MWKIPAPPPPHESLLVIHCSQVSTNKWNQFLQHLNFYSLIKRVNFGAKQNWVFTICWNILKCDRIFFNRFLTFSMQNVLQLENKSSLFLNERKFLHVGLKDVALHTNWYGYKLGHTSEEGMSGYTTRERGVRVSSGSRISQMREPSREPVSTPNNGGLTILI